MSETANARQDYRSPNPEVDLTKGSPYPDQSAKHADLAVRHLVASSATSDSRQQELEARLAQVYATLSLRDKVDELEATLRIVIAHAIDTNAELSQTIKTATNSVVVELRRHQVRPAASGETEAA